MQNIFGLCHLNKFCIMSEYDLFNFNCIYCTLSLCFTLYIFRYLKMSVILVIFFSLLIFFFKFIVISFRFVTIDRQTFQIIQIHFIQFLYIYIYIYIYIFRNIVRKICRSCLRNCTQHIQVVPPEYVQHSFLNMICIFLHFLM